MFKVSSSEIVKVIKLCSILSSSKLLVSSRHGLAGSPGFSAAAHRHQVSFGIVHQAGWSLVCSPLELWFQPHSSLGCADSAYTPSPSTPPSAPTVSGENPLYLFIMILYLYLLCRSYAENPIAMKYKTSTSGSLH